MKRRRLDDAEAMAHLVNLLSCSIVFYAAVTRGGVAVARVLERVARSRS